MVPLPSDISDFYCVGDYDEDWIWSYNDEMKK